MVLKIMHEGCNNRLVNFYECAFIKKPVKLKRVINAVRMFIVFY